MSHSCTHAIVHCMDFRLNPSIQDFLETHDLVNTTDIIGVAGAVKDINDTEQGFVETQIDLSVKLHAITTLMLMNHTDCGAYGGSDKFETKEEEKEFHIGELRKAQAKLKAKYPNLEIVIMLGDTINNEQTNIVVVE
ncbi:MAG: hypothetical protein UU40_C0002G0037 [Candidatus Uhrbacteria bacterium GW2011_GWD2_41_121]|uniref:Carbonic anhydrase n=1 Tax=Candidatus Uhrbacteria bacterium GW2011_GWC1_41_20 TaxID=1618983 RepID=A0A0G0XSB6_9BACT|nr:MAG: hypothetical protein UT52_C0002G0037 [Candidatus Uhrbacteria bacterium GW2011_GWE1_39_46]KKR64520.1 MAG: hypothetical protein UU04_C0001G0037 [Candidatus Uhrbacteria bacterium GW2011_GWC2_40_450]KKR90592.1 MAG: hypothetical protein UU40_C0002G0037 [Candidatus Uhrbacteria bacterium GW2011_GWD2_41_121]KKR90808.1 MAG: hypothetical protein UU36_C0001G0013 [Candidatus Uhrbacteria bacterium GW2011_GWE2_41_1153]KKR96503.1 MAG: hypothetical protein UU46_C0002G0039 [Candidatus Uhrbacteria bacter